LRGSKKKHRILSDRIGAYGVAVLGRPLTGEEQYALWLLRERVHIQRGAGLALALQAALGNGRLPRKWFDAICDFPEEVDRRMYKVNADRAEARTKAKARQP